MGEQNKADAAIAKWKGRFSNALGNPSTGAWLAGGGVALLAYMLSGNNKKLKKNTLARLLLSGGAGLAAIGGVNAWDRYKARTSTPKRALTDKELVKQRYNDFMQVGGVYEAAIQAAMQETFSDDTEAIQETFSDDTAAIQEAANPAAMHEPANQAAMQQPAKAPTDKELIKQRYGDVPFMKRPLWVRAPEISRYATPAAGAVGGWLAGGALDNRFMQSGGVYKGNPDAAPRTWLGRTVEHVRNPAYSAAQGGAKIRSDAQVTYDAAGTPSMKPAQKRWVDYQKGTPRGTGNIVRGAAARVAGAGAGTVIGAGVDKYIANPLLSAARRYLLRK